MNVDEGKKRKKNDQNERLAMWEKDDDFVDRTRKLGVVDVEWGGVEKQFL